MIIEWSNPRGRLVTGAEPIAWISTGVAVVAPPASAPAAAAGIGGAPILQIQPRRPRAVDLYSEVEIIGEDRTIAIGIPAPTPAPIPVGPVTSRTSALAEAELEDGGETKVYDAHPARMASLRERDEEMIIAGLI